MVPGSERSHTVTEKEGWFFPVFTMIQVVMGDGGYDRGNAVGVMMVTVRGRVMRVLVMMMVVRMVNMVMM